MRPALAALIACWSVFQSMPTRAEVPSPPNQRIDALFAQYARPRTPGAAMSIVRGGKLIYLQSYGLSNLEYDTPVTTRTPFEIASVSKQFTAFAIALLARDGKVDLDADIRTYLPYVPDFGKRITVRHLLLHTSGLRDHMSLFRLAGHEVRDLLRQPQIVAMVAHQRELNFDPGSEYMYSNTGYILLAEIVSAVSGQSLREFTSEHIFKPLRMTDTFFADDVREIVPGRAQPYERNDDRGGWRRTPLNWEMVGSAGLMSTVADLAKWAANLSHPVIGDTALIRQITTSGTLNDGTSVPYAFGLRLDRYDGRRIVMHAGAAVGGSIGAMLAYFPDDDFAVCITANGAREMNFVAIVKSIANLYLPASHEPDAAKLETKQPDTRTVADIVGYYLNPFSPALAIERRGPELFMRELTATQGSRLVMRRDGTFDTGSREDEFYRLVRTGARITGIESVPANGLPPTHFERIHAPPPATGALLQELVGDYRSAELDTTYEVRIDQGRLIARSLWSVEPMAFTAVSADRFDSRADAINHDTLVFERDACRQVTGLRMHSQRVRNLLLQRTPAPPPCR